MPTSEQQIVKRVSELVAADSVSSPDPSWDSSNRQVISHITHYAEQDGWSVDIQRSRRQPMVRPISLLRLERLHLTLQNRLDWSYQGILIRCLSTRADGILIHFA